MTKFTLNKVVNFFGSTQLNKIYIKGLLVLRYLNAEILNTSLRFHTGTWAKVSVFNAKITFPCLSHVWHLKKICMLSKTCFMWVRKHSNVHIRTCSLSSYMEFHPSTFKACLCAHVWVSHQPANPDNPTLFWNLCECVFLYYHMPTACQLFQTDFWATVWLYRFECVWNPSDSFLMNGTTCKSIRLLLVYSIFPIKRVWKCVLSESASKPPCFPGERWIL